MRRDWDLRARKDALYYIDCGHGQSAETFWASGIEDVERLILRDVALSETAAVLEIGCGIGRLLRPFVSRVRSVAGVDISGEMIERARREFAGTPNAAFWRTDGDLAPVGTGTIDFVFSYIVFQHVPRKRAVLTYIAEAGRVLKGGGLLRFQVDGRTVNPLRPLDTWTGIQFGEAEMRDAMKGAGFEVLEVRATGTIYTWYTARRKGESVSPVRFVPRGWDRRELDGLLTRLGVDPEKTAPDVLSGRVAPRQLIEAFVSRGNDIDPAEYVAEAYRIILGRPADSEGLAFYAREITEGLERTNVIDCLFNSPEFDARYFPAIP
jgi:SAM-dependent methyltransferase